MHWPWERRLHRQLAVVDDSAERARLKAEAERRLRTQKDMWPEVLDSSRRIRKIRRENALGAAIEQAFRSKG